MIDPERRYGNLTFGQCAALGRIVTEWSLLESNFYNLFALMIREVVDTGHSSDIIDPGGKRDPKTGRVSIARFRLPPEDNIARFIAEQLRAINRMIDTIKRSLPSAWSEGRRQELVELLDQINLLQSKRNEIAHAVWSFGPPKSKLAYGKYQGREIKKTTDELEDLAEQIRQLSTKILSVSLTLLRT